jgi:hypothetical protein
MPLSLRDGGQQQKNPEDDEVHRALEDGRPACREGKRADEKRQHQQHGFLFVDPERQLLAKQDRCETDDRNGEADAGGSRAERRIEAGLQLDSSSNAVCA